MTRLAALPCRAVLAIEGEDRVAFLQGLVSNDVAEAVPGRAVWAALLTPQGKWLADFFILSDGERLLLDCERGQASAVLQRLSRYRLRSKVTLRQADELSVFAAWDSAPEAAAIAAPDPRLPEAGWRCCPAEPLPTTALGSRLGPPSAGARPARRLARPGGGKDRAAGGRLRRVARRVVEQGLLHGPGADRADQVSRPGQAPADAGGDRWPAAAARHAGAARRRRGRHMRSGREQQGWRCCGSTRSRRSPTCGGAVLAPRRPPWMRSD